MSYTITNTRSYQIRIPPTIKLAPGEAITLPDAYDVGMLFDYIQQGHITVVENATGGGYTYFAQRINFNSTAEQSIVAAQATKAIHIVRFRLYNKGASAVDVDVMDALTAEGSPNVLETLVLGASPGGIVLAYEEPAYWISQVGKSFVLKANVAQQMHGRLLYRVA
jgi:hypothetical protein